MAYTKMWEISNRLDAALKYIKNEKKTVDVNDEKFETCINCNQKDPFQDMMHIKEVFHKKNSKRLAYHAIQSFEPGEIDAQTCHEIGVQLAMELFGSSYQIVVTTHLDKDHLHNHILINSTSFVDGKQFTNSKKDRKQMMEVSDRLCREYGLTTIENPKKGTRNINYHSIHSFVLDIRKDFDCAIKNSCDLKEVYERMKLQGYLFKRIDGCDCIMHPMCNEPIPFSTLGKSYTDEKMYERLSKNNKPLPYKPLNQLMQNKNELTGFRKIYFKWLVLFGVLTDYQVKKKLSPETRKELKKLDRISEEVRLMSELKIETIEDLYSFKDQFKTEMKQLQNQRISYYNQGRGQETLLDKEKCYAQAREQTPKIKELRHKIKLLEDIELRSERLQEQTRQMVKNRSLER